MLRLAWLSLSPGLMPPDQVRGVELQTFNSAQALLDQPERCDVVVLDGPGDRADQALSRLLTRLPRGNCKQ